MGSAFDDHAHEAELPSRGDLVAADNGLDGDEAENALDILHVTARSGGSLSDPEPKFRPPIADDDQADAFHWTRSFVAEREDTLDDMLLDDLLAAARDASIDEESVRRALPTLGVKARRDGRLRRRSTTADVASPSVGTASTMDPAAENWTRAFLDAHETEGVAVSRDDLRRAADEAGIDRSRLHRALSALGVPATRKHVGRQKRRARRGETAASLAAVEPGSERPSNRVPGGKVRIIAVDLDADAEPVDALQPMSIEVRIRCDEPGRLTTRVLVRGGQRAEVEALAPVRDVIDPGVLALRCDIPADALGALRHAVDVEVWLETATETYASIYAGAQRFKSRERGGHRPFVRLDAAWSGDSV